MSPIEDPVYKAYFSFPRTRGDEPYDVKHLNREFVFSPHTRG